MALVIPLTKRGLFMVCHLCGGIVASLPVWGSILCTFTGGCCVVGTTPSKATAKPKGDDSKVLLIGTPMMEK